jgi:hypothetical protein
MTTQVLLSGWLWRVMMLLSFVLLVTAIVYAGGQLLAALNSGVIR